MNILITMNRFFILLLLFSFPFFCQDTVGKDIFDKRILHLPNDYQITFLPFTLSDGLTIWMSESEVTQDQYAALFSARPWEFISRRDSTRTWFGESYGDMRIFMKNMTPPKAPVASLPVHFISWDEAFAWCEMLNIYAQQKDNIQQNESEKKYVLRLPTVSEWQTACGKGKSSFWYKSNSSNGPQAVKTKEPNDLGFYDLLGNVSEWSLEALDVSGRPYWEPPRGFSLHRGYSDIRRIHLGGSWNSRESDCNPSRLNIGTGGTLTVSPYRSNNLNTAEGGTKTIVTHAGIETNRIIRQYVVGTKSTEIGFRVVFAPPIR